MIFKIHQINAIILILLMSSCTHPGEGLKEGDIIFHESLSGQSKALKLATHSRYTHVGILFKDNGKWMVYEAAQPVKKTELKKWIWSGKDYHYVVKRWNQTLTSEHIQTMKEIASSYMGVNYDLQFLWSDDRMYCSEYVWKIYKKALDIELCPLKPFSSFDLSSPAVKQKMKERYKGELPLDEPVVAPVQLFDAQSLSLVKKEH